MKKYNSAAQQVLLRILELSEDTSPVIVSFGFVRDNFCHKGLVIKSAAPAVIKAIVNDPRVWMADLTPDGLHLSCKDAEEGSDNNEKA